MFEMYKKDHFVHSISFCVWVFNVQIMCLKRVKSVCLFAYDADGAVVCRRTSRYSLSPINMHIYIWSWVIASTRQTISRLRPLVRCVHTQKISFFSHGTPGQCLCYLSLAKSIYEYWSFSVFSVIKKIVYIVYWLLLFLVAH